MKAKAVIVSAHGGPEVLQYTEVDVADPGPDEVRIRNQAIGLNFIDVYYRSGLYQAQLPHGIGFEAAGFVDAVGSNVDFLKEGDRVGYCQGRLGAYGEAHVMPASMVVKLPKEISFDEAAAVMLKGLTVQYLFRQTYRLQGNETILFHAAAGGVGLIACQWARALGVKLIGTVSSAEKAALAKKNGAWETIDYTKENCAERVKELTNGAKCPVVYDGVGRDTWEGSLDCVQPRGLLVSFGNASGPVTGVSLAILAQKGSLYVTRPALMMHLVPRAKLEASSKELFGLMLDGKIKVEIDQRYPLADAAQAHRDLVARKTTGSSLLIP